MYCIFRKCRFFFDFVRRITDLYPELYESDSDDEIGNGDFGKEWGWYASIDAVAGGDLRKHEAVVAINVHTFLYHLTYLKVKARNEKRYLKRIRNNR